VVVVWVAVVGATAVDSRVVVVLVVAGVGSTVVQEARPKIPRQVNEVIVISFFIVGF
jgi:hypothetical protein